MLRQAAGVGLALVAVAVGAAIGPAVGSNPPTETVPVVADGVYAGPALSSAIVVWGGRGGVYSARGGQHAIWRAPVVEIPSDIPVYQPGWQRSVRRRVDAVAASPTTTAVIAAATAIERLVCDNRCHTPPAYATPIFSELLVGPPEGPLIRVEGGRRPCGQPQWLARKIDVAGSSVVVSEIPRSCRQDAPSTPSRVVLVERGRGRLKRTILARSRGGGFDDVALTTRYAAWELHSRPASFVTVYDRVERKVAYRARVDTYSSDIEMDLQADGTLVGFSPAPLLCADSAALMASRAHPQLRPLGLSGYGTRVRVAHGEVAFMHASSCGNPEGAHPQLVVRQIGGGTTVLAGGDGQPIPLAEYFDFDGRRAAYVVVGTGADGMRSVAIHTVEFPRS
jgi:hypothetical protein